MRKPDLRNPGRRNPGKGAYLRGRRIRPEPITARYTVTDLIEKTFNAFNAGRVKVLIATGALVGEGFDCKPLATLFLATVNVGPLKAAARARKKAYRN